MRLAYIILAHRLPLQLARLIDRLEDGNAVFFVHVDNSSRRRQGHDPQQQLIDAAGAHHDIRLLSRHSCYWGSFGIVQATIRGIQAIADSGQRFDRVVLLSGQHYPIKPLAHIRQFFQRHPDGEFMESFALRAPNRWSAQEGPFRDLARILHWHFRVRARWLHLPVKRKFFEHLQPYGGSQWWCLSMSCIHYINDFIRDNPRFVAYFRHSFIPDELFFQTIVSNSRFHEQLTGTDLTFAKWDSPQPPYPAVLQRNDLGQLMRSQQLFARKFDCQIDGQILDLIDTSILTGVRPSDVRPSQQSPEIGVPVCESR